MEQTLVILKAGSTFPDLARELGDFEDWIGAGVAPAQLAVRVVDVRRQALPPLDARIAGAVVTGSHAMVTDRADWSEACGAWLRAAVQAGVPVLGICYGHQLLAHCLGGEVHYHPRGMELGSVPVRLLPAAANDPLVGGLPPEFPAHAVHSQSVRRLPDGAVPLAGNDHDPIHAFRHGEAAWGVQFHPEFSARAMQRYVDALAAGVPRTVVETPAAAGILGRFARIAAQGRRG